VTPAPFEGIVPGLVGRHEAVVEPAMTTTHPGGPGVLTTPSMIMLMERTAQAVTAPFLPADHTTVGFEVHVRHLAAAPVGSRVTVLTELLEVDGRKLFFRVEASAGTRRIGEGTHRRTIVPLGRLGA
jgi:predicted thioesterase